MKDNGDGKFIVQVVSIIPKTLHSPDSAERLVRTAGTLWRKRSNKLKRTATALTLDFTDIENRTESPAEALIECHHEIAEDKHPKIKFSSLSASAIKTLDAAKRHLRPAPKLRKRNPHNFVIEV